MVNVFLVYLKRTNINFGSVHKNVYFGTSIHTYPCHDTHGLD